MCELTAAVVTFSDWAAPVKLKWAATASKARRAFKGNLVSALIAPAASFKILLIHEPETPHEPS